MTMNTDCIIECFNISGLFAFSITTVVFVLLPHIGMGIVAVLEVVKCGLQDFILG